jgi:hypothetical protein
MFQIITFQGPVCLLHLEVWHKSCCFGANWSWFPDWILERGHFLPGAFDPKKPSFKSVIPSWFGFR